MEYLFEIAHAFQANCQSMIGMAMHTRHIKKASIEVTQFQCIYVGALCNKYKMTRYTQSEGMQLKKYISKCMAFRKPPLRVVNAYKTIIHSLYNIPPLFLAPFHWFHSGVSHVAKIKREN